MRDTRTISGSIGHHFHRDVILPRPDKEGGANEMRENAQISLTRRQHSDFIDTRKQSNRLTLIKSRRKC